MVSLTVETFPRPAQITDRSDPSALYARSYLLIRSVVGGLGLALPTALFVLDWLYLKGDAKVRGSISAYYHSSARDLFVGGLCIIGLLLIIYMAGQVNTWDFWLSLVAGAALLGVAFFPTGRPDLPPNAPLCGPDATPTPSGCAPVQQALGESFTRNVHFICATAFILSLALICFAFAHREREHDKNRWRALLYVTCGTAILLAIAWVALGQVVTLDIFGFTPLYVAEIVSVYAFALSWLVNGRAIWTLLRARN